MARIIFGIIVGFLVWSVVWILGDLVVSAVWVGFAEALETKQFTSAMLVVTLLRSVITSIIAGFAAVAVSKEFTKTAYGLGILLLITGIFVQLGYWDIVPLWYNLLFWLLLIPATLFGGKLKKV